MKALSILAGIGLSAVAVTAAVTAPAAATTTRAIPVAQPAGHTDVPVFVQNNNTGGNKVFAYRRAPDGRLSPAGAYATGGLGGALAGSVVDHLASQGSLCYDPQNHLLYAVNAGSDTITVFAVRGSQLSRRQVISSGGRFPVSITARGGLVYVANALDGGSIQGFKRTGDHLALVRSWHRDLRLDPTATPQFTNTPGQVAFSPDGSQLVVTTKANGNHIDVFGVARSGAPSRVPVVNTEPGTVPFGIVFDPGGRLVVAESGPNVVASFRLGRDGRVTLLHSVATKQQATCWVAEDHDLLFASNAGSANVSRLRIDRNAALTLLGATPTDAGTVDAAVSADGRYLYVQTGAKGIVDAFRVGRGGSLTAIGRTTVPGAIGGEGIAAG